MKEIFVNAIMTLIKPSKILKVKSWITSLLAQELSSIRIFYKIRVIKKFIDLMMNKLLTHLVFICQGVKETIAKIFTTIKESVSDQTFFQPLSQFSFIAILAPLNSARKSNYWTNKKGEANALSYHSWKFTSKHQ